MTTTFSGKLALIASLPGPLREEYLNYAPTKQVSISREVAMGAILQLAVLRQTSAHGFDQRG
jgi:hypothetical protein